MYYVFSKNKLKALYGYWSHCMYSCDVESYESHIKSNNALPMAKFDKYFNVVEPLIPLNTYSSNANLRAISNTPGDLNDAPSGNRHSTQSVPRFNLRDNGEANEDESWDNEAIVAQANNRLSVPVSLEKSKHMMTSLSSLSNLVKDLDELWTVNPHPPYASEVY